MNVLFGVCSCENEVVDKEPFITFDEDYTDCSRVNTDILNPILKLTHYQRGYNYVSIPYLGGRMYFVESVESLAGTHCLLHCHVDVLYTYKDAILGLSCQVIRNEDEEKWNRDLTDRSLPVSNRRIGISRQIGEQVISPLGDPEFLLTYF